MSELAPFQDYIAAVRSKVTAERYVISVTVFLRWLAVQHPGKTWPQLPKSTPSDYALYLLDSGYMPGTVGSHLAAVSRYFRWLKEQANVLVPEFNKVELPRPKKKVKDILSAEMLGHYFRAAGELGEPLKSAVMLLPCCGLRSQELVSIQLSSVRRTPLKLADGTEKNLLCFVVTGKGGNERTVPLFEEGAEILIRYLKGWRREHSDETYLFPGRYSGHLSTRALRDAVQTLRGAFKAAWTPHTMRRTYLTTLHRRGVPIGTISKIGGQSVQVLMDHYLALDEHDVVQAMHATGGRLTP